MPPDGNDETTWYSEDTLLPGEIAGGSVLRIAVSFAFLSEGEVIELDKEIVSHNLYDDIELVAAVGNGMGRQGMFSQAIWFGEGGATWKWMRVNDIQFIVCPEDSGCFRLGTETCVVVGTSDGPYYLTIPHPDYQDIWYRTLRAVWPRRKVDVKVLPLEGRRPIWWFDTYKDDWPFDKSDDGESHDGGALYGDGELYEERVIPLSDVLGMPVSD